jgi:hypothetical protein
VTLAIDPDFFDPFVHSFTLHQNGAMLAALPPTLAPDGAFAQLDPYTYDRPPGSPDGWFALGDGHPPQPPILTLTGRWIYPSDDDALQAAAEIARACQIADSVQLRGRLFAVLRQPVPALCAARHAPLNDVTYTITLNLTRPLTPDALQEAQQQ